MNRHLWIVFVGLGFWVLAVGGAMVLFVAIQGWQPFGQNLPPLGPRQPDEIDPEAGRLGEAFRVGDEAPDDQDTLAIRELLLRFNTSVKEKDPAQIRGCFDGERMYQELTRLTILPRGVVGRERALIDALMKGIGEGMVKVGEAYSWVKQDVKRVRLLNNGVDAVVYSRQEHLGGTRVKSRWWVSKRSGRWLIYDMEDLATSTRVSNFMALGLAAAGGGQMPPWIGQARRMQEVIQAIQQNQPDQAEQTLRQLVEVRFPPTMLALCWLMRGGIAIQLGDPTTGLKYLATAEELNPDLPILDLLRATAHNQLGEHEKAADHARQYLDRLGDDADVSYQLGLSLVALGRNEEAADAFRRGLDDLPDSLELVQQLQHVLPAGKKGELAARYKALPQLEDIGGTLAEDALINADAEVLELVIAELSRRVPDHVSVIYYTCRLNVLTDKPAEAAAHFKKALDRAGSPELRSQYATGYLYAMSDRGYTLTAYESAPDRVAAFRLLGDSVSWRDPSTLECLVEAHRQRHPDDVWLSFFTGWLHAADGQFDLAETAYAAGMARAADDETRMRFHGNRVRNLFQAGRGWWAYENVAPRKDTFAQLAMLWEGHDDTDSLEALVRLHKKLAPDEPQMVMYEAVVWSKRERHEEVVRLLTDHRQAILADKNVAWRFSSLLFRSLLRVSRFDDALEEAGEDAFSQAIVHAVRGDVAQTEMALDRCLQEGFAASEFYFDEDLGAALRTERFSRLRAKYPESPPVPRDP